MNKNYKRGISLSKLSILFVYMVITSCTSPSRQDSNQLMHRRIVTATYRVTVDQHPEFLERLKSCEETLRSEGFVTSREFLRMSSILDPEVIVEIFEWVDAKAFERAQKNPAIIKCWKHLEEVWKDGGFGLALVPESTQFWAQYATID